MGKFIVTDTGFLSSFLKIDRLDLLFKAFHAKTVLITGAVLHELEQSPMKSKVSKAIRQNKIIIQQVGETRSEQFGKGEFESILLAYKNQTPLLMDDRKAVPYAEEKEITVMTIPTFLLYCKDKKILNRQGIRKIIASLKEKDYYEFDTETKKRLLE